MVAQALLKQLGYELDSKGDDFIRYTKNEDENTLRCIEFYPHHWGSHIAYTIKKEADGYGTKYDFMETSDEELRAIVSMCYELANDESNELSEKEMAYRALEQGYVYVVETKPDKYEATAKKVNINNVRKENGHYFIGDTSHEVNEHGSMLIMHDEEHRVDDLAHINIYLTEREAMAGCINYCNTKRGCYHSCLENAIMRFNERYGRR